MRHASMTRTTADLIRQLRRHPDDLDAWVEYCRLAARLGEVSEMAALAPGPALRDRLWRRVTRDIALVPVVLPLFGLRLPESGRPVPRWWRDNYRLGDAGTFHYDRRTGFPLEVERLSDGGRMVLVPEGPMVRLDGSRVQRRTGRVQAFLADVHPITVEQYARFLVVDRGQAPRAWERQRARPRRPVVGVTYSQATAYAAWVGARVLGDLGWEKAARGPGGLAAPWAGEGSPTSRANLQGPQDAPRAEADWDEYLEEVGLRPDGASPFGLEGMAGNVAEWCADGLHDLTPRSGKVHRRVRGSSWRTSSGDRLLAPSSFPARRASMDLGFRLGRPLSALIRSIDRLDRTERA